MPVTITKNITTENLEDIFEGPIPSHHPDYFFRSRINDGFVFLATYDGKPAGFLTYTIWWGNCPFIELLKVKPECQKHGIGRALLAAAAEDLKSKKFKTLISSSEAVNDAGKD